MPPPTQANHFPQELLEHPLFKNAAEFAQFHHKDQFRKSGEPYFSHPQAVASTLHENFQNIELTVAGLLHDVAEDSKNVHLSDIYHYFGEEIGFLVDAVSKNYPSFLKRDKEVFHDPYEKMLFGALHDIRVLLLKLADRDHNTYTSLYVRKEKQVRLAFENQIFFSPLKEIISYPTLSIEQSSLLLHSFLKEHRLLSSKDLYEHLLTHYLSSTDHIFFHELKTNATNIIWKITNKTIFEHLMHHTKFCSTIKILSIYTSLSKFEAHFYFLHCMQDIATIPGLSISYYNSHTL